MHSSSYNFSTSSQNIAHNRFASAISSGPLATRRSPVLSRQELQNVIREILG